MFLYFLYFFYNCTVPVSAVVSMETERRWVDVVISEVTSVSVSCTASKGAALVWGQLDSPPVSSRYAEVRQPSCLQQVCWGQPDGFNSPTDTKRVKARIEKEKTSRKNNRNVVSLTADRNAGGRCWWEAVCSSCLYTRLHFTPYLQ